MFAPLPARTRADSRVNCREDLADLRQWCDGYLASVARKTAALFLGLRLRMPSQPEMETLVADKGDVRSDETRSLTLVIRAWA